MAKKKKPLTNSLCLDCANCLACEKFTQFVLVPRFVTRFSIEIIKANAPCTVSARIISCKNFKRTEFENERDFD